MQVCDVEGCWKYIYKAYPVNSGHNYYVFFFCRFMNVRHVEKYSAWNVISSFMTYYTHVLVVLQIIRPSKQWSVEPFLLGSTYYLWYCRYVTEGNTCVSRKATYVSSVWSHVWCVTLSSTQHQNVCNQVWKVLSSIPDRITEWIFERVLLYNFIWSCAGIFTGDYLRVCMLIFEGVHAHIWGCACSYLLLCH